MAGDCGLPGIRREARCSNLSCPLLSLRRNRQPDREYCTTAISSICGGDGAVHGFDETARDLKSKARPRSHIGRLLAAIETIKDVLQFSRGNALALIQNPQSIESRAYPAPDIHGGVERSILRCVIK